MRDSSDPSFRPPRRERLLSRWHLLFVGLVGFLALVMLLPSTRTLENTFSRPDRLSLQYLRLLSSVRPSDVGLKLQLVRALVTLQQLEEASKLLATVQTDDPRLRLAAWRLGLQIHIAQFTADPQRAQHDQQLQTTLAQEIQTLIGEPLSSDELSGLAGSALMIGRPDLAARIYLRLAEVEPKRRNHWREQAAKQLLASNQPAAAGMIYEELAMSESDPQIARGHALAALNALTSADQPDKALAVANRFAAKWNRDIEILDAAARLALANGQPDAAWHHYDQLIELSADPAAQKKYAKLSLMALNAANHPDAALPAVRRYVQKVPGDPQLLGMGVQLALQSKQPRLAQEWGRELLKQDPNNGTKLANQINIELAVGDAASALELARRLVARNPGDLKAREQLAHMFEWNNKPNEALKHWVYLALHTSNQKFFEHAMKMAPQLYEMELLAKLLARKAERGRMTNAELFSLVHVYEDIGEPEELVRILDAYLVRYPDHQEAWQALAQVHERRGDLQAAVATWERTARDFGSSTKEITHRAELMWQLEKPGEAYVLLRDALDHAGVQNSQDLLTRSEMASMPSASQKAEENPPQAPPDPNDAKDPRNVELAQKRFLNLLGQLFWWSEPRPETLDDYRTLWQKQVLISESAERYILLAKNASLLDEAIRIAQEAYARFANPEFLMTAMDIAYNNQRWDDLGKLIDIAHEHAERFATNKYYYLMLAEYYVHKGDFDRAQAVYLRIIELDPTAVAARANLLWMLIDHASDRTRLRGKRHRQLLASLLNKWRKLGEDQPELWMPFATGWAMLGQSKEAVSWYGREWRERPNDHLWLVGYVSQLEAISRSSDAHRLRRFALEELRPDALKAAHRGASAGDREVLKAYVELVRDVYGPGKGSRWLTQVLRGDLDPQVQKGLFAVWRNTGENPEPSYWVQDSSTVTRRNPWGRFARSVKPSQEQPPATIADASSIPEDEQEPPPAPLLVLAPDASAGEDQVPAQATIVNLEAGVQSVNDLLIFSSKVAARYARGNWAIGGFVGVNHLFIDDASDPLASPTDVELGAYGQYRHALGRLEMGIGANLRPDASLVTGWASETFKLWRGGTLQMGFHLNELAFDTRWLRIYAARHHATMGLSTTFAGDGLLNVQGNFYQYHTRTNEEIGMGVNVEADVGYRIKAVRPLWTMRLSGSYTRNFQLIDSLPAFGSGASSVASIVDALPTEFAAIGVGTHIEHRFPGVVPVGAGRWRYMADAWVGWMWPVNIPGFEMRAGVAMGLPRRQEITLSGFVANNRWLGPGVVNAGLTLGYVFR